MGYRYLNTAQMMHIQCIYILYENFVKFGLVTPELTELICECQVRHGQQTGIFHEYLRIYWTDFTIFSPYEHSLRADDGSVPYFPICQGTLPCNQTMLL